MQIEVDHEYVAGALPRDHAHIVAACVLTLLAIPTLESQVRRELVL